MGVAANVDAFDGRSVSPTPVRTSVVKGATPSAPNMPHAVGEPKLSKFNAAAAVGATTLQAADTRAKTSALRPTHAPIDHFNDASV